MGQDPRRALPSSVEASEKGLFELVDRRTALPPLDALVAFRDLLSADIAWADSRKTTFRRSAAIVRLSTLSLTAAATVVLGIPAIPERASWALPLVAGTVFLGGVDQFFAWRSRWILMEETQYRFNRLRDEVDGQLVIEAAGALTAGKVRDYLHTHSVIWAEVSRRWNGFRKAAQEADERTRPLSMLQT